LQTCARFYISDVYILTDSLTQEFVILRSFVFSLCCPRLRHVMVHEAALGYADQQL